MKRVKKRIQKRNSRPHFSLIIHTATAQPGRVGLVQDNTIKGTLLHQSGVHGHRSALVSIHTLLTKLRVSTTKLSGMYIVVDGGTFTEVRASLTTGYAIAYALHIPVATVPAKVWDTPEQFVKTLRNKYTISPRYSSPPSITRPKQR
jgi:hypothetical protein